MPKLPKGHKKLLHAWAFYDWANSVYSLVISSAIFPIFYAAVTVTRRNGKIVDDTVHIWGFSLKNDALISYVTAIAFLTVSILSPLLSGIADYIGNKKVFMRFFNYLGATACVGMFWFDTDFLWFGLLCYYLALIGFWGSLVFYNSYLPDIAFPKQQDRVSALGFSLGYIGSVILLVFCLILIMFYENFGFESEDFPTRLSFILTGIWWIGFSQYSYYYLPKGNASKPKSDRWIFNGFNELKKIYLRVKQDKRLSRFLAAFFTYSMAVQTIMLMATYFGVKELDWGTQDSTTGLIISILLIQLIAILGATLTAKASGKFGNIPVLLALNFIWVAICLYAFIITTPVQFYFTAAFVGLVMGGIQSLSRSTYSKFLPENTKDTTSFFSFYDVSEKIGIVIGMFSYGFIAQITGSIRNSILFFIVFFGLGIFFLLTIPRRKPDF